MHILITGYTGLIGRNLLKLLSSEEFIGDEIITEVTLADVIYTHVSLPMTSFVVGKKKVDITSDDPRSVEELFYSRPDIIFHLACSSKEEHFNFDQEHRVNVNGTKNMLDAIRAIPGYSPRFVFASSISASNPSSAEPQDSHETQNAIAERLISEYSQEGFVDGISLRLPTVVGHPNPKASGRTAASFFSRIIKGHIIASPKATAENLLRVANLTSRQLPTSRIMNMPGITLAGHEIIEAVNHVAGERVVKLIHQERDNCKWNTKPRWPQNIDTNNALSLNFVPDKSIEATVKSYIEDHLNQRKSCLHLRGSFKRQLSGMTA